MFGMVMAKSIYNTNGLLTADGLGLAALAAGPPGWITAILGSGAMLVSGCKNQKANNIQVLTVSRWGRPWIGGLEGYQDHQVPLLGAHTYFPRARRRGRHSSPSVSPSAQPHWPAGPALPGRPGLRAVHPYR